MFQLIGILTNWQIFLMCVFCIPQQNGYSLVTSHDGDGAFVIIDHILGKGKMSHKQTITNVYASGDHAALYSLSLQDNFQDPFGYGLDFERIEGMPVSVYFP